MTQYGIRHGLHQYEQIPQIRTPLTVSFLIQNYIREGLAPVKPHTLEHDIKIPN